MQHTRDRRMKLLVAGFLVSTGCMLDAEDMSGTWRFAMDPDLRGNPATVECTVAQRQTRLTVKCGTGVEMTGEKRGRRVTFVTPPMTREDLVLSYKADANDSATEMQGTWQLTGPDLEKAGKFTATKQK
jgi:hypothetical protein